jgi:Tfp pilus assembly protein PilO
MNSVDESRSLKATSRTMHGVGACIAMALVAVPWLVIVRPMATAQEEAREQIAVENERQSRSAAIRAHNLELGIRDRELEDRRRGIFERIPESAQEASFLGQITELASRVGFSIRDYRPGTADRKGPYGQLEVTILADGSYEELCRFIHGIDGLPRFCRLISVTAQAPEDSATRLRIDLKVRIFFNESSGPERKGRGGAVAFRKYREPV